MKARNLTAAVLSMLKRLAKAGGVSIHRSPASRFDAMDEALAMLRARGYRPRTIIDVGANVGQWSHIASRIFPEAAFHLIEPQTPFAEKLRQRFAPPKYTIHDTVVTRPGIASVRMTGLGSTGARVMTGEDWPHDGVLRATTLDALLGSLVRTEDRALLKLDVEGHEIEVLKGAVALLPNIELVIAEVLFYDVESSGTPVFFDVVSYLHERGFQLYDIAALASRPRDQQLRMGDVLFVRKDSALALDTQWG